MLQDILLQYGLAERDYNIKEFGTGLINHTWKVTGTNKVYILQRINTAVFKSPENIDHNLRIIQQFLSINAPDYLFAGPLSTEDHQTTINYEGNFYRLQHFIKNSHTVDAVTKIGQAYHAAKQFGKFSRLLTDLNPIQLKLTLPNFHNLTLRFEQFNAALTTASAGRLLKAADVIAAIKNYRQIADDYKAIVEKNTLPVRVIHHDTKISNVLFDDEENGLCVIDLDTVMPGYFISDVGDMMRTYLCEATEEESDTNKIVIRLEVFKEIFRGYMEEMGSVLTLQERQLFSYSGKFMIYMQAIRFLTDYLNNDIYYPIKHPEHNLLRAINQVTLLRRYIACEPEFKKITG